MASKYSLRTKRKIHYGEDEGPDKKKFVENIDISMLTDDEENFSIQLTDDDDDFMPEVKPQPKKKVKAAPKKKATTKRKAVKKPALAEILISEDESDKSKENVEAQIKLEPQIKYPKIEAEKANVLSDFKQEVKPSTKPQKHLARVKTEDKRNNIDAKYDKPSTSYKLDINIKDEPKKQLKHEPCENIDPTPLWTDHQLLGEQKGISPKIAWNIIKLFEDGNTIPFIARYRRDATGNMSPEGLREVKESFEEICHLKQKMQTVLKTMVKLENFDVKIEKAVRCARSIDELEVIYAPFKPGAKRSLAERAKELGLEGPALDLLNNTKKINLHDYVDVSNKLMSNIEDVQKGVVNIIAYIMATDSDVLSYLRELRREINFTLESKRVQTKQKSSPSDKKKATTKNHNIDESKFEHYFDYKIPVKFIKPHQVLAINRGEHHKFLSVKIVVPDIVFHKFSNFCFNKWIKKGPVDYDRKTVLEEAIKDSYNRLVQPLIIREIRAELKTIAEKASFEVFSKNLKHLLLAPPLKGQPILAIDPGYTGGCKLALVSPTGSLLAYDVIYLHKPKHNVDDSAWTIRNMLEKHNCSLIALGNGTACRETEEFLTQLIQDNYFYSRDVKYTIVSEDGASTYSCSPEAKKEFPDLDTNIISAVSLARRILDPLAELVKVEPQHLGVGMYQHDLKRKPLEEALNDVVSECVSFVGVDLNTASQCLLRRIAGLSEKRATQIIQHREKNGPFLYRKQLTQVFGIGARIFEQCAGFLRVGPADAREAETFYKNENTTKLDCTYIHPESYSIANKIMKKLNVRADDIGKAHFINAVKSSRMNVETLSEELKSTPETVKLIIETLGKPLSYDLRKELSKEALFKKGLRCIEDISEDTILTGRVKNVTHFGCFVDVGLGKDALIHRSKQNGFDLQIGDRVEVRVISLDIPKKRIGLEAVGKL